MSAVTVAGHGDLLERRRSGHLCDFGHGGGGVRLGETFLNHFSPSLYATSDPAQIVSSSPTSMFPLLSPYVVNDKRRDFPIPTTKKPKRDVIAAIREEGNDGAVDLKEGGGLIVERTEVEEDVLDAFFSHSESASAMCQSGAEEGGNSSRSHVLGPNTSCVSDIEYYDATEDFGPDRWSSQASPLRSCSETDLRSARLNMFEEIERRKKMEESLLCMQNQWKKMSMQLSNLGLLFPPIPDESNMQSEADVIIRSVFEAIDREVIQDEIETSIKAKNNEISRLHDRLRYYETVYLEMSRRNQKAIENFRRKCEKRRRRRGIWKWGSIGLSFTIGLSLLAYYSFTPPPGEAGE